MPPTQIRERLNLRLIIVIPSIFFLVSLATGLVAATLTQSVLQPSTLTSKNLLYIRLAIVGSSLLAGFLGSLLAYGITKPVRKAISEAQEMIRYAESESPPLEAANEVRALTALFDQAYVSFIELVQAREILDSINEGIIALDRNGKVAGMNLKAQEILEIPLAEGRHASLIDLLGDSPPNGVLASIARKGLEEQQERIYNQIPFSLRSGEEILLTVKVSPLRTEKKGLEFIGVVISLQEHPLKSREMPEIIGQSEAFIELLDLVRKIAPTDSTVLLLGESGTGKEMIADAIHRLSQRKDKPFVKLNCAAIPEGLLESDLFGHEKGAFTGATAKKRGKFAIAHGGTIFLDEIGDMTPSTQAKVLRVLQQKEFLPVGGSEIIRVDVRIVAATNHDLLRDVQEGRFREDLFFRLNVMTLTIPPLRDRKSDIPFLADHFLEQIAKRNRTEKKTLTRGALNRLLAHSWPGNVRELENALERATLLSNGSMIQLEELPLEPDFGGSSTTHVHDDRAQTNTPADHPTLTSAATLNETLEAVEKELIVQALRKTGGIQVEAARLLGLKHKNLWHKIKKHKIDLSPLKTDD